MSLAVLVPDELLLPSEDELEDELLAGGGPPWPPP
jgi:hypothetical protein